MSSGLAHGDLGLVKLSAHRLICKCEAGYPNFFSVKRVPRGRLRRGDIAAEFGVSVRTVHKWLRRFHEDGRAALANGASAPVRHRGGSMTAALP
jgi:hypothetical protein